MREIKFRAWKVNWMDNDPTSPQGDMLVNIPIEAVTLGQNLDFQGSSLQFMQYTGLKDKNGKEIYEGDVLRFTEVDEDSALGSETTYVTEVKWIDDLAQWRVVFPAGRRTELHCVLQIPYFYDQEVIGNIYENPELLT